MATSKEGLSEVSQLVDRASTGRVPDVLGSIGNGVKLVRRTLTFQQRSLYNQRLLPKITTQPILGLEIDGKRIHALPYEGDVDLLKEDLRNMVVDGLKSLAARGAI